jgi:hypothetical protein
MFGGEKVVSTSRRASVALMSFIFLVALVSAVPVEAKVPLRWEANVTYTWNPTWTGIIMTEDGLSGTIALDIAEARVTGDVEHSILDWWIEWDGGGYIEGTLEGILILSTYRYTFNGQVTDTSEDWAFLDGRNVHVMGSIDLSLWTTSPIFQIN